MCVCVMMCDVLCVVWWVWVYERKCVFRHLLPSVRVIVYDGDLGKNKKTIKNKSKNP